MYSRVPHKVHCFTAIQWFILFNRIFIWLFNYIKLKNTRVARDGSCSFFCLTHNSLHLTKILTTVLVKRTYGNIILKRSLYLFCYTEKHLVSTFMMLLLRDSFHQNSSSDFILMAGCYEYNFYNFILLTCLPANDCQNLLKNVPAFCNITTPFCIVSALASGSNRSVSFPRGELEWQIP